MEVLPENWNTVQVFMQCQPTYLQGGLSKPLYQGIPAIEIEAAARLCRVDVDEYEAMRAGVRVMADATAKLMNGPA